MIKRKAICGIALALVLALCALPISGCTHAPDRFDVTYLDIFDTVTTISAYCETDAEFAELSRTMYADLSRMHRLFDIYNEYDGVNNLCTVNRLAGTQPVTIEPEIIELLSFARDMFIRTGGKVNVCFGSVLSIWHEYREAGVESPETAALPPMDALAAANAHTSMDDLVIDAENSTVYFKDPELKLDCGAIAKGFAAQRACELAAGRGANALLLSLGGNVCTVGVRADGATWEVGVTDPSNTSGFIGTVQLAEGASLVTSSGYQRYYEVDGEKYHHIIDPVTLMPTDYIASVTVTSRDSGLCDAMSTALFNMPFEEGEALAKKMGVGAIWVLKNGTIIQRDIDMSPLT